MMDEWFVEIAGREIGPLSAQQLRNMAAQGRLLPSDRVRHTATGNWIPADHVKGLMAAPEDAVPAALGAGDPSPPPPPVQNLPRAKVLPQPAGGPPPVPVTRPPEIAATARVPAEPSGKPARAHVGEITASLARARRNRRRQMLISASTVLAAVGVIALYVYWAAGGFDNPPAPSPTDQAPEAKDREPAVGPVSAGKAKEDEAGGVAAKSSPKEKSEPGQVGAPATKLVSEKPAPKPEIKEEPEEDDHEDESKWIDASSTAPAIFDKIQVKVWSAAWEGPVPGKQEGNTLVIALRVENTGVAFPVMFAGWSPEARQQGVILTDNRRKTIPPRPADPANTIENMLPIKINPGKSAKDVLIFEAPSPKVKYVRLQLSAGAFGKEGTARFRIPVAMIEGTPPPLEPPKPKAAEKKPPAKPAEKLKTPAGREPTSNPKDDFGIDPNDAPPL
jgi:hypothetical protein